MSSNETDLYTHHDDVLDAIRDLWPTLKGINILLFQNDLFKRIRQLEVKVEGLGTARGFLPASFGQMVQNASQISDIDGWKSGNKEYDDTWSKLMENAIPGTEDALDVFEDDICGWVQDMIPTDYNFFTAALDEGTLNAEWLGRAQVFFEKAAADAAKIEVAEVPAAPESIQVPEEPVKPAWKSANTRRRHAGQIFQSAQKKRVRLTRRAGFNLHCGKAAK
jgi:hypothetical protein